MKISLRRGYKAPQPMIHPALHLPSTALCVAPVTRKQQRRTVQANVSQPDQADVSEHTMESLSQLVEKAKAEEESISRRREEMELQLLRLQKQEALKQQQALQTVSEATSSRAVLPNRKRFAKKSKRMTAMAASAGARWVNQSTTSSSATPASNVDATASQSSLDDGDGATAPLSADPSNPGPLSSSEICTVPKPIFIISDCTGESAARTVRAALNQFEICFKTSAPASILVFRFVEDDKKAFSIVETAKKENALVVYTLVNPETVKAVKTACTLYDVRAVDLWSNLLDQMEEHLDSARSGKPMSSLERRPALTEDYFKMIEAVEYTRKMDDGANPQQWKHADLLILGVSRCGKTPLSIYLGQRGFKVANLPLVANCPIPKELYEIDQTRIVGLIIDPQVLLSIRRNRVGLMGVKDAGMSINYAEISKINEELALARDLYRKNPHWPVLDVTLRGVEESAARILKILNDKRGDASPMWVEELYGKSIQSAFQPARPQPSQPVISEQIYAGAEQYLVEGLY